MLNFSQVCDNITRAYIFLTFNYVNFEL